MSDLEMQSEEPSDEQLEMQLEMQSEEPSDEQLEKKIRDAIRSHFTPRVQSHLIDEIEAVLERQERSRW